MPRLNEKDRKQVGTMSDGCGAVVMVYLSRNGYLYTVCPNCGADQRNGARVQNHIFHNMTRLEGVTFKPPKGVSEQAETPAAAPAPHPEPEPAEPVGAQGLEQETVPAAATPAPHPEQHPEPAPADTLKGEKSGGGLLAAAVIGLAVGLGFLLTGASKA